MSAPDDIAGLIERLNDYGLTKNDIEVICDKRVVDEAAAALSALSEENKRLRADLAKVIDPEYLAGAIERVGLADAEWQARAVRAEAQVRELRAALEPFASYMDGGHDLNHRGEPLPDDQGVGWVYLTVGDFRRARATLKSTEPSDD